MSEAAAAPIRTESPVAVREGEPGDRNFVLKTMLLALRNSSHLSWHVSNPDFFEGEQRVLKRILGHSSTLIAHPHGDRDLIAGFLVYEPGTDRAHFAYTKAALRRQGVARALLAAAGLDPGRGFVVSTPTHDLTKGWIRQKYPAVRYNPYLRWE